MYAQESSKVIESGLKTIDNTILGIYVHRTVKRLIYEHSMEADEKILMEIAIRIINIIYCV